MKTLAVGTGAGNTERRITEKDYKAYGQRVMA